MSIVLLQFKRTVSLLVVSLVLSSVSMVRADNQMDELVEVLRQQLTQQAAMEPNLDWTRLYDFYVSRGFHPVWVDSRGPLLRAERWRQALHAAEEEGLKPEVYRFALIEALWHRNSALERGRLELLLTDAFFKYSMHLRAGRLDPRAVDPSWHIAAPETDAVTLLRNTLAANNFDTALKALAPPHAGYRRLRDALARYRRLAEEGGWPSMPHGPYLKYGRHHPHVGVLRRRLIAEGDLSLGPVQDVNFFDQAVEYAVERFQVRHGLKMDGIVGPATRAAMNVPITTRIEQIKLNMERWRWLPRRLGARYIMVNTAAYELAAIEDGQPQFTMWVIIGKPERPTPVVGGLLHTVVFNPYWTVPSTIVLEDLIPEQQKDPKHLKTKGIRVFSNRTNGEELDPAQIDWSQVDADHFPYIFRQDPGPTNPLGRIKFLFSNDFEVYLHDTPTRRLFNEQMRAFSSGCIRVESPIQMASYLLGTQNGWTRAKIEETIASGESRDLQAAESVPIYLVYWTAWVGVDNVVYFRKDVYERDPRISDCDAIGEPQTG